MAWGRNISWNLRHGLNGLTVETRPERSERWDTIWAGDMRQLGYWIKMRRGKDETRNKAEMQADATRTELRCIRSTDCTVFRHSMTALLTVTPPYPCNTRCHHANPFWKRQGGALIPSGQIVSTSWRLFQYFSAKYFPTTLYPYCRIPLIFRLPPRGQLSPDFPPKRVARYTFRVVGRYFSNIARFCLLEHFHSHYQRIFEMKNR